MSVFFTALLKFDDNCCQKVWGSSDGLSGEVGAPAVAPELYEITVAELLWTMPYWPVPWTSTQLSPDLSPPQVLSLYNFVNRSGVDVGLGVAAVGLGVGVLPGLWHWPLIQSPPRSPQRNCSIAVLGVGVGVLIGDWATVFCLFSINSCSISSSVLIVAAGGNWVTRATVTGTAGAGFWLALMSFAASISSLSLVQWLL